MCNDPLKGTNLLKAICVCVQLTNIYRNKHLKMFWHVSGTRCLCFLHHLNIRRLPERCPRFLPGFYPYLPQDLEHVYRNTYQTPTRQTTYENKAWKTCYFIHMFFSCSIYSAHRTSTLWSPFKTIFAQDGTYKPPGVFDPDQDPQISC